MSPTNNPKKVKVFGTRQKIGEKSSLKKIKNKMSFWRKVILCLALLPQSDGSHNSVDVSIPIHNAEASFWSTNLGLLKKVNIWCQGSSNQKRLLEKFHGEIEDWDTSKVTLMTRLFPNAGCDDQNPNVSKWDVSNVRSMYGTFEYMENFNQNLSGKVYVRNMLL